jgi:hypothetical protein
MVYNAAPNSGNYKGFELKGTMKTKPNMAKLTFTNGKNEISVIGSSLEDAFIKAFDMIDSYEETN